MVTVCLQSRVSTRQNCQKTVWRIGTIDDVCELYDGSNKVGNLCKEKLIETFGNCVPAETLRELTSALKAKDANFDINKCVLLKLSKKFPD